MSKRKTKLAPEKLLMLVESYLNGNNSLGYLAKSEAISRTTLERWITIYENEGPTGLFAKRKNTNYPVELKMKAVNDYLNGLGSLQEISKKYKLRDTSPLRDWLKSYNTHRNFKSESGGSRMSKARKTTFEEPIEIVHDCLMNQRNYGQMAIKYQVSYQQVRNWVLKYEAMGEMGLQDRRGHRAGTIPSRTLEGTMHDQLAIQERRIKQLEMENNLLKKVRAFERMWS